MFVGSLFQSRTVCGKEYLWQSSLNVSGWYARLCRLREWRLTGVKYFCAGMAAWPGWFLWNTESLASFLLFSKVSHWRDISTAGSLVVFAHKAGRSSLDFLDWGHE